MSSTIKKPDWLTAQKILELKEMVLSCANPYTEEDVKRIELDGKCDLHRYNAFLAKQTLEHYGIL